jgi:hypothetical protein
MFREMRRHKQLLSMGITEKIMAGGKNGVLGVLGDDGYPYVVPLSYVYINKKIYFHSSGNGHKIDAIKENPKVSFSVIDRDETVSAEYTSYFRSAIVFGNARVVQND